MSEFFSVSRNHRGDNKWERLHVVKNTEINKGHVSTIRIYSLIYIIAWLRHIKYLYSYLWIQIIAQDIQWWIIETTNAKTFSEYIYYARLKRNSSEDDISFEELIFLYLSLILIFLWIIRYIHTYIVQDVGNM